MIAEMGEKLSESYVAGPFRPLLESAISRLVVADKKHAGLINREFLDWFPQLLRCPYALPAAAGGRLPLRAEAEHQGRLPAL
jgi:hypothetical protein